MKKSTRNRCQGGVDDFNSPDHAAGVLAHKAASVPGAAHEVRCIAGGGLSPARWQVLEVGEDEQVLVACERTRPRKPRGGTSPMARRTPTGRVVIEKAATHPSPEESGSSVASIFVVVLLPAPLESGKPAASPAFTKKARAWTAVHSPKGRVRVRFPERPRL
jgi:hypothetical protein